MDMIPQFTPLLLKTAAIPAFPCFYTALAVNRVLLYRRLQVIAPVMVRAQRAHPSSAYLVARCATVRAGSQ